MPCERYGTVRAGRWSVPRGRASATVRVDSVGGYMTIGVVTSRYGRGAAVPEPPARSMDERHVAQPVGLVVPWPVSGHRGG